MHQRLTDDDLHAAEACARAAETPGPARDWLLRLANEVRRLRSVAHPEPPLKAHGDGLLDDRGSRQGREGR